MECHAHCKKMSFPSAKKKDPEVVVFVEPTYSHRRTKEAMKEKDRFLVGLAL